MVHCLIVSSSNTHIDVGIGACADHARASNVGSSNPNGVSTMFNQSQVIALESISMDSITVLSIDDDVRLQFETNGVFVTVERAAESFAQSGDRFYRTILSAGAVQGIYNLAHNDNGKFDSKHTVVKSLLGHVSEKTTTARKYASEILNLAWRAVQNGLDPFGFASVSDLRKAGKPTKETVSTPEQDQIATNARQAAQAQAEAAQAQAEAEAEAARQVQDKLDQSAATIAQLRAKITELEMELVSLRPVAVEPVKRSRKSA